MCEYASEMYEMLSVNAPKMYVMLGVDAPKNGMLCVDARIRRS